MLAFPDFQVGAGILEKPANTARNAILTESIEEDKAKPISFLHHKAETRAASNDFILTGNLTPIACMLGVSPSEVPKQFLGSYPGFANNIECTVKPGRTDKAYTILALGDLSFDNGLPALGVSKAKFTLKSGEALHFMGDVQQMYSGLGGGTLIWFHWSYLPRS